MFFCEFNGCSVKVAVSANLQEKISWVAISHRAANRFEVLFDQVVNDICPVWYLKRFAHDFEKFSESGLFGVMDLDFVGDSPKERVVHEIFGLEVGAKDDELVEGDLDFFATADTEEIVPLFKGYHPSVKQFVDAHPLTAKVVDQQ
jgi:hypothetical protein